MKFFLILSLALATTLGAPVHTYTSPYYAAPATIKYAAPAPYVHHDAHYTLPYHTSPVVKAVAAPLAQSYTTFSQVVTHPQPIVKVHAEPVHYPVHYDPAPLKYSAAPLVNAEYGSLYAAPYAAYPHH